MAFYSHPERQLKTHLMEVARYAVEHRGPVDHDLAALTGLCHDFGKYTTFFQRRLLDNGSYGDPRGNHSYLSALFGAHMAKERGGGSGEAYLVFSAIFSHHSRIKSIGPPYLPKRKRSFLEGDEDLEYDSLKQLEILGDQIRDLQKHSEEIIEEWQVLAEALGLKNPKEGIRSFLEDVDITKGLVLEIKKTADDLKKGKLPELFWQHQLLYSLLITGDKLSAAGITPLCPGYFEYSLLDQARKAYLDEKAGSPLSRAGMSTLRQDIFSAVQGALETTVEGPGIYTITAPTGSGKTLTGFYAAQRLKARFPQLEKLVYVLPYTSIIDQNYEVIRNLYTRSGMEGVGIDRYLMKHHHLALREKKDEAGEIYSDQAFQMLLENWAGGTVVTTFVQFLQSIIGGQNKMLRKVQGYPQAVVILDEIQAVDVHYYSLLNHVLEKMCEHYGMIILMMTATRPLFFPHATELLWDYRKYFKMQNRTQIHPRLNPQTIDDFCEDFCLKWQGESTMIVVNTIQSSLSIYAQLKDKLAGGTVRYLSTNIIPKARRERIEILRKQLKTEKLILVTTQVIEAGVDISFDRVIRDLAPLDSIIQCAGRCNRNGGEDMGLVEVVKLVNDNKRAFAQMVYGSTSVNITEKLLQKIGDIQECDYLKLIDQYYNRLKDNIGGEKSERYLKALATMDFDSESEGDLNHFSLIQELDNQMEVYVMVDEAAENAIDVLKGCCAVPKKQRDFTKLADLKKAMQQYTLSLPIKLAMHLEEICIVPGFSIFVIGRDDLNQFYDPETGFIRAHEDTPTFL